mgnify:CR=1 FL=1
MQNFRNARQLKIIKMHESLCSAEHPKFRNNLKMDIIIAR